MSNLSCVCPLERKFFLHHLRIHRFMKIVIVMALMVIVYIYVCSYFSQITEGETFRTDELLRPRKKAYSVDSPTCKIPNLEPFDVSVSKYFHVPPPKICSGKRKLTYQRGNMLMLNLMDAKNFCKGNFTNCEYRTVIRKGDNNIEYSLAIKFTGNIVVKDEFIRVKCFCRDKKNVYTNFHTFVYPVNMRGTLNKIKDNSKKNISKEQEKEPKISKRNRLNVLLIGLDSISRLNSYRQLSDTRNFLLDELGAIELKGYNKVGDNTFVNIIPMLYGKYVNETPWKPGVRDPFDNYDLMWSKYHRQGYRTLYAEDCPGLSAFNGIKAGFSKPPTDHYFRPMGLAMERENVWSSGHHCMKDRLEIQVITQYIFDFVNIYKSESHFVFTFLSRISHDDVNLVGTVDYALKDFFRKLHNEQLLNDTLLLFFSDHGIRFGDFRKTYQGKLEERLPMMYIVLPKWFPERFPRLWKNLRTNTQRLTTPFDIHETMLSALNLEEFERNISKIDLKRRGISLFAQVPENRTCLSATILPHWCTCQERKTIPVKDNTVVKVAGLIVRHINHLLNADKGKCSPLKLDKIQEAFVIRPNEKLLKYVSCKDQDVDTRGVNYGKATQIESYDYQLTLRTTPSLATFEATVKYKIQSNTIEFLGDISRTNLYGSQSKCTSNLNLKKYCYCK